MSRSRRGAAPPWWRKNIRNQEGHDDENVSYPAYGIVDSDKARPTTTIIGLSSWCESDRQRLGLFEALDLSSERQLFPGDQRGDLGFEFAFVKMHVSLSDMQKYRIGPEFRLA